MNLDNLGTFYFYFLDVCNASNNKKNIKINKLIKLNYKLCLKQKKIKKITIWKFLVYDFSFFLLNFPPSTFKILLNLRNDIFLVVIYIFILQRYIILVWAFLNTILFHKIFSLIFLYDTFTFSIGCFYS